MKKRNLLLLSMMLMPSTGHAATAPWIKNNLVLKMLRENTNLSSEYQVHKESLNVNFPERNIIPFIETYFYNRTSYLADGDLDRDEFHINLSKKGILYVLNCNMETTKSWTKDEDLNPYPEYNVRIWACDISRPDNGQVKSNAPIFVRPDPVNVTTKTIQSWYCDRSWSIKKQNGKSTIERLDRTIESITDGKGKSLVTSEKLTALNKVWAKACY